MTDTDRPLDEHLADQLDKLADHPRTLTPDDRASFLHDVATRLRRTDDQLEPVKLEGSFVFHPRPMVGDLAHPAADNGWLLHGVTYDEATQIAASLTRSGLMP